MKELKDLVAERHMVYRSQVYRDSGRVLHEFYWWVVIEKLEVPRPMGTVYVMISYAGPDADGFDEYIFYETETIGAKGDTDAIHQGVKQAAVLIKLAVGFAHNWDRDARKVFEKKDS